MAKKGEVVKEVVKNDSLDTKKIDKILNESSKIEKILTENSKIERVLVENFVSLQKVMTNLAIKFENLSSQISKLLDLFEISAKTIAEKEYPVEENKVNSQLVEKVENLMEQNRIIARGISLLHEKDNSYSNKGFPLMTPSLPLPPSRPPQRPQTPPINKEDNEKARTVSIDSSNSPRIRNTEV